MDLITCTAILPLLFGCLGIFGLFRLLQWIRMKAYLRNAVVVVTGATSGLGRGGSAVSTVGCGEHARQDGCWLVQNYRTCKQAAIVLGSSWKNVEPYTQ